MISTNDHLQNHIVDSNQNMIKAENYFKANNFRKLHIGCDRRIIKGWLNIDRKINLDPSYPFYSDDDRGDLNDFFQWDVTTGPFPFEDNSVDIIYHEDFFEHLDQREQLKFLEDTYRVMRKGAIQRINTPALFYEVNRYKEKNKISNNTWDVPHHKCILTRKMLQDYALIIGFDVVFQARNKSISDKMLRDWRPEGNKDEEKHELENRQIYCEFIKS